MISDQTVIIVTTFPSPTGSIKDVWKYFRTKKMTNSLVAHNVHIVTHEAPQVAKRQISNICPTIRSNSTGDNRSTPKGTTTSCPFRILNIKSVKKKSNSFRRL